MKHFFYQSVISTILTILLLFSYSCKNSEANIEQIPTKKEAPTTMKPALAPVIDEAQMQSLTNFHPSTGSKEMKYRSTDEVFGLLSDRSYAYNECKNAKITYFIYGGNSEEQQDGRWFSRKILKWDAASGKWQTFFDDGVQYLSNISDDISLQKGSWYYTLQWVWDPAAKKWITFNANLLVQI